VYIKYKEENNIQKEFALRKELKEKIEIRMTIEGKLAERLNRVKEYYQVENYTDLIRFLITKAYEERKREGLPGTS
jgi:hypothetical protein